ncbi:MAG: 4-(cytidine 5'-diphospho)-2-C-methyl-D-erythritol kinase [Flavisolibacter sp.]
MIVFPNCKINLGLHVVKKRTDGFHDLHTVFYPMAIHDALEIIEAPAGSGNQFSFSGIAVEGKAEDNICAKAYHLLKKDFPQLPAVSMHLHKNIPVGAGLGGGSADGAFALQLLNKKFKLELSSKKLAEYALMLGSDCPFFLYNKPCFATGRGETLQPIDIDLSSYKMAIVNPGIHINTGWAFQNIIPALPETDLKNAMIQPVENWRNAVSNDFEQPVFNKHPEIKKIKEELYDAGALFASMSGSGSTVYGIFSDAPQLPSFPTHYFVKII